MNMMSVIGNRVCDQRLEALRAEFGTTLADRIIEAEAVDFLWEARVSERYLGQQCGGDWAREEGDEDLSLVLVLSSLAGAWVVGLCLVDGEGSAVELVWKQPFPSRMAAEAEYGRAH